MRVPVITNGAISGKIRRFFKLTLAMLETNPISQHIEDLLARIDALRGYL